MKRSSSLSTSSPSISRSVLVPIDLNTLNSSISSSPQNNNNNNNYQNSNYGASSSNLTTPQNNNTNNNQLRHNRTDSTSSNFSTQFSNLFDASSRFDNISSPPSSSATSSIPDNRSKTRNELDSIDYRESSSNIVLGEEGSSAFKRRKFGNVKLISHFDTTRRKVKELLPKKNEQISVFELNKLRLLGLKVSSKNISARPYLKDFVSHNEKEVFRCSSYLPNTDYAAPYSLAFSRAAKAGGKQVFAVGDHDGKVTFLDAAKDNQWHSEKSPSYISAHVQAVFDVLWSNDDKTIATASGDSNGKIFNVETKQCIGVLLGHTGTIKKIDWHHSNPNLLSTASRDGSIRIWDLRLGGNETCDGQSIATVNHIKNAHGTKGKPSKGFSAVKSVTSVAFLPQKDTLLASSGSYDGTVKVWDLRRSHSRRVNPEELETNELAVSSLNLPRSYGISSMSLSPNGQKLYAYSRDSKIYAFDPLNLTQAAPLTIFSDKRMTCDSFYVHLAISPCSRYLASASSDNGVYLFDTEGSGQDGIKLSGHEKESLSLDWSQDKIVSCSDDSLIRVWKNDSQNARRAREDHITRWRWSGTEDI